MPIRITLESLEDDNPLHSTKIAPGNTFVVPDYVGGQQNVLYIASRSDDLGGRIYRRPDIMENDEGEIVREPEEFGALPPSKDAILELPIAGTATHNMTTKDNDVIRVRLKHVGRIVMLFHPDTNRPLLSAEDLDEETAKPDNEVSKHEERALADAHEYDPFEVSLN